MAGVPANAYQPDLQVRICRDRGVLLSCFVLQELAAAQQHHAAALASMQQAQSKHFSAASEVQQKEDAIAAARVRRGWSTISLCRSGLQAASLP